MTGEVTITGRVLPVGGIKEKFLAAYREGVKTILFPHTNEKDVSELPEKVRKELTLIPVSHMDEVLPLALEGYKAPKASAGKKASKAARAASAKKPAGKAAKTAHSKVSRAAARKTPAKAAKSGKKTAAKTPKKKGSSSRRKR